MYKKQKTKKTQNTHMEQQKAIADQIKQPKHWPFSQPTSKTSTTTGIVLDEGNAEL